MFSGKADAYGSELACTDMDAKPSRRRIARPVDVISLVLQTASAEIEIKLVAYDKRCS